MTLDPLGRRGRHHHGNLPEAMVAAALRLIAEHGPSGFAYSDVARLAGVSAAAPYRHFRDRNALIAEVARRGFEAFGAALEAAWNGGRPDPIRAIENCGRAYLDYARREPAYYAAMMAPGVTPAEDPALLKASDQAFAVMRRAAEAACGASQAPGRPPPMMVALHVWSMAHGIASLFVAGAGRPRRALPMSPEALLEAGLLVYLGNLALDRRE